MHLVEVLHFFSSGDTVARMLLMEDLGYVREYKANSFIFGNAESVNESGECES